MAVLLLKIITDAKLSLGTDKLYVMPLNGSPYLVVKHWHI